MTQSPAAVHPDDRTLAYLKRVTAELMHTRDLLERHRAAAREPIAIVGMGCRLPGGVHSPEDLWDLVVSGRDAISEFPNDRGWDLEALFDPAGGPDASKARGGGFVHDVADFDAAFFGISPDEAVAMDPKQRLVLECGWESLERAGIDPIALRGSATGVYVGSVGSDYARRYEQLMQADPRRHEVPIDDRIGAAIYAINQTRLGESTSILSSELSYLLGLVGPAVTVDAGSASSAAALHLAVQSLRQGECELALAGGVAVMATPHAFLYGSRIGFISPSDCCRPFAADADGPVFSEGVAMVVLERLSDARRHRHPVWAVVRGSAFNQAGSRAHFLIHDRASQEHVIGQALHDAGLTASDIDVVEATTIGHPYADAVEAEAVLATYGLDRASGQAAFLGSLKSNLGHLQAASGLAAVIKMVMAMRHGVVPPTLHLDVPSPNVDWSAGAVELATEAVPWPPTGRPRRAGVSSSGIGGCQLHIVLEQDAEVPAEQDVEIAGRGVVPWVVSGRSARALAGQALRLGEFVAQHPEVPLRDVAWSLAAGRARLEHRAVVLAGDRAGFEEGLAAVAEGRAAPGVVRGVAGPGRVGFVFGDEGSPELGVGRHLCERFEEFSRSFQGLRALMNGHLSRPLPEIPSVAPDAGSPTALDRDFVAHCEAFACQVATFDLLWSWGVRPDLVLGYSLGEISAAHAAGILGREDAVVLELWSALRRRSLAAGGAAGEAPSEFQELSSPAEFAELVAGVTPRTARIPLISAVTGRLAGHAATEPAYWLEQPRGPVDSRQGALTLAEQDVRRLVELGNGAGHSQAVTELFRQSATDATVVSTTRGARSECDALVNALAELHVAGVDLAWPAVVGGGRWVESLPTYAFQRERYWFEGIPDSDRPLGPDPGGGSRPAR